MLERERKICKEASNQVFLPILLSAGVRGPNVFFRLCIHGDGLIYEWSTAGDRKQNQRELSVRSVDHRSAEKNTRDCEPAGKTQKKIQKNGKHKLSQRTSFTLR